MQSLRSVFAACLTTHELFASQVRQLTGLYGGDASSAALLHRLAPHLEKLEMVAAGREHLEAVAAMPALRSLTIKVKVKDGGAVPPLPPRLQHLRMRVASLEHMHAVATLTELRTLDVWCPRSWADAPSLSTGLEELVLYPASHAHLLAIQVHTEFLCPSWVDLALL